MISYVHKTGHISIKLDNKKTMRISNPLDKILNNETKIKILRFLFKTGAQWNGRQIAKEIGASPTTIHKALQDLQEERVLVLHNIGKTHVYSLNQSHMVVVKMLKPLFAKEEDILGTIIGIIKKNVISSGIRSNIISVVIFGSVNAHKDHSTSDIDLAVVVDNLKTKKEAERLFDDIADRILRVCGNVLSPYINTKAEFKTKHRDGVAVIKSILRSYSVIYGKKPESIL